MQELNRMAARLYCCVILIMSLTVSGCSLLYPEPVPEEPDVINEPLPPVEPQELPQAVVVPKPTPLPPIAIVLASSQPAYADVARELASNFEHSEIYDLSDNARPPVSVLSAINDSDSHTVVAIGLRAAKSSVAMSDKPVVFSQVFNYQDHGLVTDNSRGVATVAPLDAQLAAWKRFDPGLEKVGAVIGEGHEDMISEAKLAAERHGVALSIHVTHSDQETLYFFKRMVRDIDGFWLFPDNRVLSRRALQQIMEDAQRHQVAVMVPSESMLQIGASISASSVASDIAATITKVVRQIEAGQIAKVPAITPLSEIRVEFKYAVQVVDR
jgi:ABC-type uncharacterized transport system substrate-binding protein